MLDIVIAGGRIVDGTGNPWYRGDVGIADGRIAAIGKLEPASARTVIDATARVVCPGFIDTHTHSDLLVLGEPLHEPAIRQGITTEVLGQDGRSFAPVTDRNLDWLRRRNPWAQMVPSWDWSSMGEFRKKFDRTVSINTVHLVGYSTVCQAIMGQTGRLASAAELTAMQDAVGGAMEEGAVGLSTALEESEAFDTDQIVALCKVVARYGGVYVTHRRQAYDELHFGGIREGIEIGQRAGVSVHFSHFKGGHGHPATRGRSAQMLGLVATARARGVDVTVESYPYIAGSSPLISLLQNWVTEGEPDEVIRRIKDPAVRERIREEVAQKETRPVPGFPYGWPDYASSYLAHTVGPEYKRFEGRAITEIADSLGADPVDVLCDILIANDLKSTIVHFGTTDPQALEEMEFHTRNIMRHHAHMVGSDSLNVGSKPHPRAFGTFPRYLGRYCRELGVLTLEDTIRKMTSLPAQRFGLGDRGILKQGLAADIVVFDPQTIADRATYQEPKQYPVGIDYVLVNGGFVLAQGVHTGLLNGRPLPDR